MIVELIPDIQPDSVYITLRVPRKNANGTEIEPQALASLFSEYGNLLEYIERTDPDAFAKEFFDAFKACQKRFLGTGNFANAKPVD